MWVMVAGPYGSGARTDAERCDALLRVGGAPVGADQAVERIGALGGRVFCHIDELPDLGR